MLADVWQVSMPTFAFCVSCAARGTLATRRAVAAIDTDLIRNIFQLPLLWDAEIRATFGGAECPGYLALAPCDRLLICNADGEALFAFGKHGVYWRYSECAFIPNPVTRTRLM